MRDAHRCRAVHTRSLAGAALDRAPDVAVARMGYVVVVALQEEAEHLLKHLDARTELPLLGGVWPRTAGTINGAEVEVVISHVGIANAAAATTAVLLLLEPVAVLNFGCAGAHAEALAAGDVIIGAAVIPMDAAKLLPDGTRVAWGYRKGGGPEQKRFALPANPVLLAAAEKAGAAVASQLPKWPGEPGMPSVRSGTVGSSDTWSQQVAAIRALAAAHGTDCEEMEASSIATVCDLKGVPFLCVKDISNNEMTANTNPEDGLEGIEAEIGARAAHVLAATIAELADSKL